MQVTIAVHLQQDNINMHVIYDVPTKKAATHREREKFLAKLRNEKFGDTIAPFQV